MCQSVTIDGFYTGQVQQMADHLGVHPKDLVWLDGELYESPNHGFKFCLCPINLEATADKFGFTFDRDDYGDGRFTKIA